MFKNCDFFFFFFKQVIDDACIRFRDLASAFALTIPVRKILSQNYDFFAFSHTKISESAHISGIILCIPPGVYFLHDLLNE